MKSKDTRYTGTSEKTARVLWKEQGSYVNDYNSEPQTQYYKHSHRTYRKYQAKSLC